MAYIGASYLFGLFFASFFQYKECYFLGATIIFLCLLYYFFAFKKKKLLVCGISCGIAIFIYGCYDATVYKPIISYNNQVGTIQGTITNINLHTGDMATYTIKGQINGKESSYFTVYTDALFVDEYDEIVVTGLLEKPKNSYTFPGESYYKAEGIFLCINNPTEVKTHISDKYKILKLIHKYRNFLCGKICSILPNKEGSLLIGILCGDKDGLDDYTKTNMYRSGIGHIMSVSGMHLTIITALVLSVLKKIGFGKKMAFWIMIVIAIGFTVFAGMSISVMRSFFMIAIVHGADIFRRKADCLNSLGIAGIILTITCPFAIRSASFLLSFAGVLGIGVLAPMAFKNIKSTGILSNLYKSFAGMIIVSLTVFPVSLMFFDEISIISPIVNTILVPVCSAALICGVLFAFSGGILAVPFLLISGICCKIVLFIVDFTSKIPGAYTASGFPYIKICAVFGMILTCFMFIMHKNKTAVLKAVAVSMCSILILSFTDKILKKDILNIAILGDKKSSVLVINRGTRASVIELKPDKDNIDICKKYLITSGISAVNYIIPSDKALSNITNYANYSKIFKVGRFYVPENHYFLSNSALADGTIPIPLNTANVTISIDGYNVKFLKDNKIIVSFGEFSMLINSNKNSENSTQLCPQVIAYYEGDLVNNNSYSRCISLDKNSIFHPMPEDKIGYIVNCKSDGSFKVRGINNGTKQ